MSEFRAVFSREYLHAFLSDLHQSGHHLEHRSVAEWLEAGNSCLCSAIKVLRDQGWIVCDPVSVPIPRSKEEAQGMNLISERWLKDHKSD